MLEGLGLQKVFAISIRLGGGWIGGPFIAGAVSTAQFDLPYAFERINN